MNELNWVQWLLDNGHLLMLWSNRDNIKDALYSIMEDKKLGDKIQNFFGIDPSDLYWEYNLLLSETDGLKETIEHGTTAKYNYVKYCEHTIKSNLIRN